jgi:hypothetical protein
MGGISRRTFKIFRELCGQKNLANVIIVTNMWSNPPTEIELKREMQLRDDPRYFQPAIKAGAQFIRRLRENTATAHNTIRLLLAKNPIVMQVQRELVDDNQVFFETSAAQVLGVELAVTEKRHQQEIEEVKEELRVAKEEKDTETQHDLREFLEQAKVESARLTKEIEALRHGFDEERARWQRWIEEAHRDRDAAERRHGHFGDHGMPADLNRQCEQVEPALLNSANSAPHGLLIFFPKILFMKSAE